MIFSSHVHRYIWGALGIVASVWFTGGSAQACLNTHTPEPCQCIHDMLLTQALGGPRIATPSLSGGSATEGVDPAAATISLFAGDQNGFHYYSKGTANTGGNGDMTITVGDTVTWTIDQPSHAAHTITSLPGAPESFDSGFLFSPGDTFSHTFLTPGSYTYYCSNHAGYNLMNGIAVPFGTQVATIQVVAPEPGSVGILMIGAFVGVVRRRRNQTHAARDTL